MKFLAERMKLIVEPTGCLGLAGMQYAALEAGVHGIKNCNGFGGPANSLQIKRLKELYKEGLRQYELMDYFEAHEIWEELWSNYYLKDRRFIQGLIQLSVSFVHLGNGNMIGAKNLLRKSKEKFLEFSEIKEE